MFAPKRSASFGQSEDSLAKRQRLDTTSLPPCPPANVAGRVTYSAFDGSTLATPPHSADASSAASRNWFTQAARAQAALDSDRGGETERCGDERCRVCASAVDDRAIECAHCEYLVCEIHSLMCDECQDIYCTVCSTLDYSGRFERGLCLDCNEELRRAASPPSSPQRGGGASWRGSMGGMEMSP